VHVPSVTALLLHYTIPKAQRDFVRGFDKKKSRPLKADPTDRKLAMRLPTAASLLLRAF
jgi:hypothetical protein